MTPPPSAEPDAATAVLCEMVESSRTVRRPTVTAPPPLAKSPDPSARAMLASTAVALSSAEPRAATDSPPPRASPSTAMAVLCEIDAPRRAARGAKVFTPPPTAARPWPSARAMLASIALVISSSEPPLCTTPAITCVGAMLSPPPCAPPRSATAVLCEMVELSRALRGPCAATPPPMAPHSGPSARAMLWSTALVISSAEPPGRICRPPACACPFAATAVL